MQTHVYIPSNDNINVEILPDKAVISCLGGKQEFFHVLEAKCFIDSYYLFMQHHNSTKKEPHGAA